ncbi:hypothetical protein JW992_11460 [candidate division KSB1 bacterium]|nr:hypothetical protein [candidate division KSB1 bacterium]
MKRFGVALLLAVALLFALGCGKSKEESQAEKEMQKAVELHKQAGEEMAKDVEGGAEAMAETMKEMGETITEMGEGGVEPVDFRELKALLPESLPQFNRENAQGEKTSAFGVRVSQAEADYRYGEQEIHIEITDMGGVKSFIAFAGAAWMMTDIDRESDSGYEKTITYKGHRGFEEYDSESNFGEIQLIVSNRFMIEINGRDVKMEEIEKTLDRIDLGKLEKLAE